AGKDGVHPGWAGQTVIAYAFLKGMGLNGDIGVLRLDLKSGAMKTSPGHKARQVSNGEYVIESSKYPFCPCVPAEQAAAKYPACGKDDPTKDDSIRSAMRLVPFNQDLNRFLLVIKGDSWTPRYRVSWGEQSKVFEGQALADGINLAEEFPSNPFCSAFAA